MNRRNAGHLKLATQSDHQANAYVLQNRTFHSYCSLIRYGTVRPGKERTASIVRADAGLHIVTTKIIIKLN
jgi:hypothetical protein